MGEWAQSTANWCHLYSMELEEDLRCFWPTYGRPSGNNLKLPSLLLVSYVFLLRNAIFTDLVSITPIKSSSCLHYLIWSSSGEPTHIKYVKSMFKNTLNVQHQKHILRIIWTLPCVCIKNFVKWKRWIEQFSHRQRSYGWCNLLE